MNFSAAFVRRPVATTLLTFGIALAGAAAFFQLAVAPLPQVDYPTISVRASMPGASPQVMAATVATPLERHLGQIADVSEITSSSSVGSTRITLQFGLDRDIDGAARDVQAAINAARADLPTSLRSNPTYRKVNPADAPIMILSLTSDTLTRGQIYDAASTVMQQKLSQIDGVGEVDVGGASLPAVRVELNPAALFKYGIGLEDVRAALAAANAHAPKGAIEQAGQHFQLYTNDQASRAADYRSLIVAYRNGAAVRLSDVADIDDSVENIRNFGEANGKPSVLVILSRTPGGNIIDTIDRIKAELPQLEASIPSDIKVSIAEDRSTTIRASLHDVEITLAIATALVIVVVFLFLRDAHASLIPMVAVPVSLLGTLGVMYLLGYSLDNLSLMALTISTGFVVDDAIVVLENITRHIEAGMPRFQAALQGAREVGFTVLSMSLSLIAVFIPILLMGGIIGRLFREFAVTLSIAILVSLLLSLTTTPMMCARLLRRSVAAEARGLARMSARAFDALLGLYRRTLGWALAHPRSMMLILLGTLCLNVYLFVIVPKGFFPQQDTGRIVGGIQADQSISYPAHAGETRAVHGDRAKGPRRRIGDGFHGRRADQFRLLLHRAEAAQRARRIVDRGDRRACGASSTRYPARACSFNRCRISASAAGRATRTINTRLQSDNLEDLYNWAPKIATALQGVPEITDVNSDQQQKGLETDLNIDRAAAARLGVTVEPDRQHALRRVRPASGVDHLQSAQSVSRGDGGGAALLAGPRGAEGDLYQQVGRDQRRKRDQRAVGNHDLVEDRHDQQRGLEPGRGPQSEHQFAHVHRPRQRLDRCRGQHQRRDHGAAFGRQQLRSRHHAARGQSSGHFRRLDHLVQPGARQIAERCDRGHRRRDAALGRAGFDSRHLPGNGARLPAILGDRAFPHPRRAGRGLYRAWVCSMRAISTRSRFSRPCPRPASAPCWRC